MQLEIYAVYDFKSKFYTKPFYFLNRDLALRDARDWVLDASTAISRHPEDYALFFLGTFDDQTAQITLVHSPETVLRFHEIKLNSDPMME